MGTADVAVVGGGIAGVSAAHELAARGLQVELVEREPTLAHHATGRSAAQFLENYGNPTVRRLTVASRSFFADPPPSLVDGPLWRQRPFLRVGTQAHQAALRADAAEGRTLVPSTEWVDADTARSLLPVLGPQVAGGLHEPEAMELDVAALHQAYVRGLRAAGGGITVDRGVTELTRRGDGWRVATTSGTLDVGVVVDAAGAWADDVAVMAGVRPLGLHPLRRTVAVASLAPDVAAAGWPLVAFETDTGAMEGYAKPEPGGLLVSPADETPSPPCDARPEEIDVARALDVVGRWTALDLRHVATSWAGLRTFTGDRTPVAGADPEAEGFVWLAGQGGYGIQTAPSLARAVAGLIVDGALPADLLEIGLTAADLAPTRPGARGPLTPGH